MLQLKKIFPLLGLLVGICFLYGMSEISQVFAYVDTPSCSNGICFTFDSDSATNGYRFGMGARINVTGVSTTSGTTPAIKMIPNDGSPIAIYPMMTDSAANPPTAYLGAVSGLPTYVMIEPPPNVSCVDPNRCDPFILLMNQPAPGASSGFVVQYFSDITTVNTASPIITSSTQSVTAPTDDTIMANPYQPYKNVRAACVNGGTWNAISGFCTNWKTSSSTTAPSLSIPFTASGVTATYQWQCAISAADQLASNFTKDWPCNNISSNSNDVYLEIDYMKNHKPDNSVILDLINSFSQHGINLHVQLGEQIAYKQSVSGPLNGADSSDFTVLKNAYFGTSSERTVSNTPPSPSTCSATTYTTQCVKNLLTAKRQVFHYVLFGDQQTSNPTSSGVSEGVNTGTIAYAANDIFISLGQWNYKKGSAAQMESTLMHELGHNLGLNHGGPFALENTHTETADVNCKPNYLSVMSYTRQFPTLIPDRALTYSSEGRNTNNNPAFGLLSGDIDESSVNENTVSSLQPSTTYFFNQADPALSAWLITSTFTPDWNNNNIFNEKNMGVLVLHASTNPNNAAMFPIPTPAGTRASIPVNCGSTSSPARLYTFDDWDSLGYDIWGSSSAYDGGGGDPIPSKVVGLKMIGVSP